MPRVYHRRRPWVKWAAAVALLLWVWTVWEAYAESQTGSGRYSGSYLLFLILYLLVRDQGEYLVLAGHVLLVRRGKLTFNTCAAFREAVEQAVEVAR